MDMSSKQIEASAHNGQTISEAWRSDLELNYASLQKAHLALQKRCIKQQATIELQANKLADLQAQVTSEEKADIDQTPASTYVILLRTLAKIIRKFNNGHTHETVVKECLHYHKKVQKLIRSYPETAEETTKETPKEEAHTTKHPTIKQEEHQTEDTEEGRMFIIDLSLQVNEILGLWTKHDEDRKGYDVIQRWLDLTQQDAVVALRIKQNKKEQGDEQTSASTYVTLLQTAAINLRKHALKDKYTKTQILDKCIQNHEHVHGLIQDFVDAYSQKNPDVLKEAVPIKVKSAEVAKKTSREKQRDATEDKNEKPSRENQREIAEDKKEKLFLKKLPDQVKQMFRKIGFTKWSKDWLPLLVLSPFDVVGELRDEWMRKYDNYLTKKRPMEHLIVWYGCDNSNELYGWVSEIIPYEEAVAKDFHLCPKRLVSKIESGKKLTRPERVIVDGFEEMEQALNISESDRWVRFNDANEDTSDEENSDGNEKEADMFISSPLKHRRNHTEKRLFPHLVNASRGATRSSLIHGDVTAASHEVMSSRGFKQSAPATSSSSHTPKRQKIALEQSVTLKKGPLKVDIANVASEDGDNTLMISGLNCNGETAMKARLKSKADELLADANFIRSITVTYNKLNLLLTAGAPKDILTMMDEKLRK